MDGKNTTKNTTVNPPDDYSITRSLLFNCNVQLLAGCMFGFEPNFAVSSRAKQRLYYYLDTARTHIKASLRGETKTFPDTFFRTAS